MLPPWTWGEEDGEKADNEYSHKVTFEHFLMGAFHHTLSRERAARDFNHWMNTGIIPHYAMWALRRDNA